MRNLFIICILSVKSSALFGQIFIPELKNSVTDISNFYMVGVQPLLQKSESIIMYRTYSAWGNDLFKIISFENDNAWHAYILKDSTDKFGRYNRPNKYNWLFSIVSPQDSLKLIWQTFVDNDIFSLKDENRNDTNCKLMVSDAPHYEIIILTKKKYKIISYYAPAIFEEECPGNIERQKIIRVIRAYSNSQFFQSIN